MKAMRFVALLAGLLLSMQAFASQFVINHEFSQSTPGQADIMVVFAHENQPVTVDGWSTELQQLVNAALQANDFTGKQGQRVDVAVPAEVQAKRLIVVGMGEAGKLTRAKAELAGANLVGVLPQERNVTLVATLLNDANAIAAIAHGMDLKNYRFDTYKSKAKARSKTTYHWHVANQAAVTQHYADYLAIAKGVFLARDITNLPGGDGYPQAIAEMAAKALKPYGIKVTILKPNQVRKAGMGALYGVSQGSEHKSYLLAAQWEGSKEQPIALVGKGNTFDTGGYNLKTSSASIVRMQTDKAGGGAVLGTVMALAAQQAPVNVVAVVPLSHNLISGSALLPGDVVTAGDGTTIEVVNTDAEGRLILADGIWYARDKFKPRAIADIATLTGSKVGALGNVYSAVFSEHDDILATMKQAGETTEELVWELPLGPYPGIISSHLADIKNTGSPGAQAGAIFLQHFAKDTPWIHIDMAGNAFSESPRGIHPAGANGYGVRLLTEWVKLYSAQAN